MPTNWPLEARLALLHECWLAAGHEPRVSETDGARKDWYLLSRAILDDTTAEVTTHQRLYAQLKKTAVWPKVLLFLTNGDKKCATCQHSKYIHVGYNRGTGSGPCIQRSVEHNAAGEWIQGARCTCTQFVVKPMR